MTDQPERRDAAPYAAFRLNLEQQKKRAKERASSTGVQLAKAQFEIANGMGFASWARLKGHIAAMDRERTAMSDSHPALDGDLRTLHLRCGSDLRQPLVEAGFNGDFLEHSFPYSSQIAAAHEGEEALRDTANYERVVIWSEYDTWDQLTLLRFLGHYARHARPRVLELINVRQFPGNTRFIGLGQLPPEALRLLWNERHAVTAAQLALGVKAWSALCAEDPRALAVIATNPTLELPLLGPALHRHLRQLPSLHNGLSLTEQLILQIASESPPSAPRSQNQVFVLLNYERDPLPSNTDLMVHSLVQNMQREESRMLVRNQVGAEPGWNDTLEISPLGRQVLAGEVDWLSLTPPRRWVGGVAIGPGLRDWRWDETQREVVDLSSTGRT